MNTVTTLNDAFGWCKQGFDKLLEASVLTHEQLARVLSDREVTTSTAFSGVGAPENADTILSNTARDFLGEAAGGQHLRHLTFKPLFAIEFNRACQKELLALPGPPQHVFGNILDFFARAGEGQVRHRWFQHNRGRPGHYQRPHQQFQHQYTSLVRAVWDYVRLVIQSQALCWEPLHGPQLFWQASKAERPWINTSSLGLH